MGLHFSLLASVAAIVAWVIQTENGGLLNVLFRVVWPSTGHDLEFDLIPKVDESVVNFFTKMLLLQPLPLPILQVIPASLGGGQAAVDNAHANPNRSPDIFWTTVFAFLFAVVLIIIIQVVNCCCCCYREKDPHNAMNAPQMALLRSNSTNKQFTYRVIYIVLLVLTLVFLATSIILLIVYFSSTGLVLSYLQANPQPSVGNQTPVPLLDGLHATVLHASSFVHKGIAEGRVLTNRTLHDFVDRTYGNLRGEVMAAFDRLLLYLGVTNALEKGEEILSVLKTLSTNAHEAHENVTLLHNKTASLETNLTAVRAAYTQAFGKVKDCGKWQLCKTLNATVANIASPIPAAKLNASLIDPYIEGFNQTTTNLYGPLDEVRDSISQLRNSTNDVLDSLKSQLNFTHILDRIEKFWNDAQSQADKLLKQLNEAVNLVETQVRQYVHDIQIVFYIVGGVFMIMLIIATLIAMRLIYQAIHDRLFAPPNTAFVGSGRSKLDKVVCSRGSVCCCSALFIPLLLVFAAVIAVLLFVLTTISSEGCIYLEWKSAVRMSDFVINGYVALKWKALISGAVGRSADFLNTSPPRNILFALTQTCSAEASQCPVGLFSALGYHSLINVAKIVDSQEVTDAIQQGKETIMAKVGDLDILEFLPSGEELEAFGRVLNATIANLTLTELINNTNPDNMNTSSFEKTLGDIEQFSTYENTTGANFTKPNKGLTQAIKSMRKIKPRFSGTHHSLQDLDARKSSAVNSARELIGALNASRHAAEGTRLKKEVEKEYDKLAANMKEFMKVDGEATFASLTASLFLCEEAHAAYSAVIGVTCGEAGGVRLLIGVSYILALNVLFLTFLFFALFILAFFQALRIRMFSDTAGGVDVEIISQFEEDILLEEHCCQSDSELWQ